MLRHPILGSLLLFSFIASTPAHAWISLACKAGAIDVSGGRPTETLIPVPYVKVSGTSERTGLEMSSFGAVVYDRMRGECKDGKGNVYFYEYDGAGAALHLDNDYFTFVCPLVSKKRIAAPDVNHSNKYPFSSDTGRFWMAQAGASAILGASAGVAFNHLGGVCFMLGARLGVGAEVSTGLIAISRIKDFPLRPFAYAGDAVKAVEDGTLKGDELLEAAMSGIGSLQLKKVTPWDNMNLTPRRASKWMMDPNHRTERWDLYRETTEHEWVLLGSTYNRADAEKEFVARVTSGETEPLLLQGPDVGDYTNAQSGRTITITTDNAGKWFGLYQQENVAKQTPAQLKYSAAEGGWVLMQNTKLILKQDGTCLVMSWSSGSDRLCRTP